jgi:stage II sporulation protein AA (anti-sigma F factor antagonist)
MPKELDHHVAQRLCGELDMLIETNRVMQLVLDFSDTEFMDSSGIGVIIGRSRIMQFRGGKVVAIRMGKRVNMLFHSAGLEKIVEECDGRAC